MACIPSHTRLNFRELRELVWDGAGDFVRVRLVMVLVLQLTASVLTPLGPVALKLLVDKLTNHSQVGELSIGTLISLYILSQWLSRSLAEVRGLVYARAERRMFRTLSERLFQHVMRLPLRFHLDRQTGSINQILENGLSGYHMIMKNTVFTVLPVAAQLATIVIILLRFHQPIFLAIFCAAFVCYAVAFSIFTLRASTMARSASAAHINANAAITDNILNYETIKLFAAEAVVQDKVVDVLSRTEDRWVDFFRRYAYNGQGIAAIYATFLAIAVVYAANQVASGGMTIGDFVLVNTYMLQLMQPVEMLGYAVQEFSQGIAMLAKLLELFRERTEPALTSDTSEGGLSASRTSRVRIAAVESKDTQAGPEVRSTGELIFNNVSVSYRAERPILKEVSFAIPAGNTLGIVGPSGSGKSTIVRLLVRLIERDGGEILLDGVPTSRLSLEELRRAVAVVPQDTVLFDESIAYNIAFGRSGSTQKEVEEAARLAHLHDFIMNLPDQYSTRVGERGVKLSGGEKQRVSIARVAIKRPKIYVFDESTSSLDSHCEKEILRNLREISRSCTTLIIAHRLSTVVHADEIIVLDGGRIVERGTHSSLLRQDHRYAALWRAQQRGAAAA
jgi:ATP-binding cassette subfamily B protein